MSSTVKNATGKRPILTLNKTKKSKAEAVQKLTPDQQAKREAAQKRKEIIKSYRKQLCVDYPDVFNTEAPKPLAIGIHKQLFAQYPDFSNKLLRLMLARWVNNRLYKEALLSGGNRYNLDGSVAGVVSDSEIAHVKKVLSPQATAPHKTA